MSIPPAFDDELARRLPLPLAKLYRRAHNAKAPKDRHDTAFYLWEATLRLLASAAVASYAERPGHDPGLDAALRKLARPALGDWLSLIRRLVPILAEGGDAGCAAIRELLLGRMRDDLPRAAELDGALRESLGLAEGPKARVRPGELLDRLVQYRNREIGHGALGHRPKEFHARIGQALLAGISELLGRLDVLAGRRLVYVEEVRLQKSGQYLIEWYELTGESARRIASLERPAADAASLPKPEQVYLDAGGGHPEGAAGPLALIPLRPLLVYDPRLDEVLFLNSRGRGQSCNYLCFTTGEHQELDELEVEQRGLLARMLGQPVDPGEFARWGELDAEDSAPTDEPAPTRPAPLRRVGEFELLSELGRGNMGTVYRARQPSLGRQVALKVIAGAGDTRARARFRREVRALGRVDHPHLVKIFTSRFDEEPYYFTMELVEGVSLAAVSDTLHDRSTTATEVDLTTWREAVTRAHEESRKSEKPLSSLGEEAAASPPPAGVRQSNPPAELTPGGRGYVPQVVELVRQVAQAAHALHAAGVVHRDIKPGNIMVTADGAQAILMDLGLAQLADDVEGRLTRTRQFIGTLRYASPEQILSVGKLDARSDVYSLGATLWELLTLRPIYAATDETPDPELMRRITSDDPERIRKHHPGIAADLEAIVQKCLEKDPARRYESAAELAGDLDRWLRGDLVTAQPLTLRYWAGKLARRHRWPIAAAAAMIVLVASGAVYEISRSNRANERLSRANRELNEALAKVEEQKKTAEDALARADAAGTDARKAADKAEAINNFLLNDMLAQAAPELNARERKVTVEELLDRANARIGKAFAEQPEVQAAIRTTMGTTYWTLGEFSKAEPLLRRAWESRRDALGPQHHDTLNTMHSLALVLKDQGKLAEAATIQRQVLEARRRILGPEHSSTLTAMNTLVQVLLAQGKFAEAETMQRGVLEAQLRILGPDHPETLIATSNLALALQGQDKSTEAERIQRQVLDAYRRVFGPEHPYTLISMNCLAGVLKAQGKFAEAETINRQVLEVQRRILGPEHVNTLISMDTLASVLEAQGRPIEAETICRQVLEARRRVLRPDHPATLYSMNTLARLLKGQGKLAEAETIFRQIVEGHSRISGPNDADTLTSMNSLGMVLHGERKFAEAETILRQVLEAKRRVQGPEHPDTLNSSNNLMIFLLDQGKAAEAEPLLRELLRIRRKAVPVDSLAIANTLSPLGWALIDTGRAAEAEPLLREALAIRQAAMPPGHWAKASTESILGACLAAQGRYAEAESLLRESLAVLRSAPHVPPERVRQALGRVIALYDAWGKPGEAAAWRLQRLDLDFPDDPFVR
jgi:serine/threonine protein kinase